MCIVGQWFESEPCSDLESKHSSALLDFIFHLALHVYEKTRDTPMVCTGPSS